MNEKRDRFSSSDGRILYSKWRGRHGDKGHTIQGQKNRTGVAIVEVVVVVLVVVPKFKQQEKRRSSDTKKRRDCEYVCVLQ